MTRARRLIAGLGALGACLPCVRAEAQPPGPAFTILPAAELRFPGAPPLFVTDCNSPAHWVGGTLYIFNSWGHPWRMHGPDLEHLSRADFKVAYTNTVNGGRWLEATLQAGDVLYGWYHLEPNAAEVCPASGRTAPRIGALRSRDNGDHWDDLGLILEAPAGELRCDTPNQYFAGGHGDFSVIEDNAGKFVYFLYDNYGGSAAGQGVSIARMDAADLPAPAGKVWKRGDSGWDQPGLGGAATPIFPVARDWHDARPDAFWGPSIHWNTEIREFVVLLNHATDPKWAQEGIYLTANPDLENPAGWSLPQRLPVKLEGPIHMQFYPQIFGTDAAKRETDKRAGSKPRLFVAGVSRWVIAFGSSP